ncbi:MAG: hypothetical protein WDA10_14600 [Porticoccaceae bacterium]
MSIDEKLRHRLQFLVRVVERESRHLSTTDTRLFTPGFDLETIKSLEQNAELAERVEAFVARFGRLQDTLGDKLLPAILAALGEKSGAFIDNLDRAERLGWIESVDEWMTMRKLRNQMVHDYVEDPVVLSNALQSGHVFVGVLVKTARRMTSEIERREW